MGRNKGKGMTENSEDWKKEKRGKEMGGRRRKKGL